MLRALLQETSAHLMANGNTDDRRIARDDPIAPAGNPGGQDAGSRRAEEIR
ncbi:hypothetical protein S40285_10937 [Stachybotrys chlorohalonatus IBT 40285]|uniref:Uncharacterized protein n=1 Tax=Stachybotrys chlorohalonatus (strain IBT 40285) TaxID=1283841 RepID=A0A084QY60_STAC4|nr:hypothetical protein S40285_10937 [Stachybotrys chlorohalonata IBT 40285]